MLNQLEVFEEYENVVVVRSNHDDFLDRWLKNEDWKKKDGKDFDITMRERRQSTHTMCPF